MSLEAISQKAGRYVLGVPWDSFTEDPYQDVYGRLGYIIPLREAMRSVQEFADEIDWMWEVYNDPDNEEGRIAWYGVRESILDKDSALMAAINVGKSELLSSEAPKMDLEVFRAFVSKMFSNAMFGYSAHMELLWQSSDADPYTIVRNADFVHGLCTALRAMYDMGALNPLLKGGKKQGGIYSQGKSVVVAQNGLGALGWVTGAVIAVVVLGLAAILAWYVLSDKQITHQRAIMNEACRQAFLDPSNRKKQKACRDAQKWFSRQQPSAPWDIGISMEVVATFAGIGLLVYAGSLALPNVLEALDKRAR